MNKLNTCFIVLLFVSFFSACTSETPLESARTGQADVLGGASLAGSRQGQAVGFVDVDGDGIDDKIVGAPYAELSTTTGAIVVYKGGSSGYSSKPSYIITGGENFGYSFVTLGDVTADGHEDYAVGAFNGGGTDVSLGGSVTIYKGGVLGNVVASLSGEGPMDKFGLSLAAGDLNGDGLYDLISGAPFNTNSPALYQGGAVYVHFAPAFTNTASLHASSQNKGLGWGITAGDINGDGTQDLCIGATGKVLCYYGGGAFSPAIDSPDVRITSSSSGFGKALAVIGDIDGDGYGELAIGAPNATINSSRDTGSVYIIKGGTGLRTINADTPPADLIVRIDGTALFDRFGSSVVSCGPPLPGEKPGFAVSAPLANSTSGVMSGRVFHFKGAEITNTATISNSMAFDGFASGQGYGTSLAVSKNGLLLIGAPRGTMDTGGVSMVDMATGQLVPGGSSGGSTGGDGECH